MFDASEWGNMLHGVGLSLSSLESDEDCRKNQRRSILEDHELVEELIPIYPINWSQPTEWSKESGDFLIDLFGPEEYPIAECFSPIPDQPSIGEWSNNGTSMGMLANVASSPCPFRNDEFYPVYFEENNASLSLIHI